ncbi:MAG TPA: hypothetical protein VLB83_01690 [Candidatus Paceibacterota bacterium]|nr:hypothetical protein [Candidatus Paceibacterota bacterium]
MGAFTAWVDDFFARRNERRRQYALCEESAIRIRMIVYRREVQGEDVGDELAVALDEERKNLIEGKVDPVMIDRTLEDAQVLPVQFWLPT